VISAADDKSTSARRQVTAEVLRFVIVGGINTATTYVLYLVLLRWTRYEVAYGLAYVVGIVVAYALSTTFVFRRAMRARSAARFPLVYALQFFISFAILRIAVQTFGVPHWLALGVSIAVTMPITFVLSRIVVRSA
jgi:putative flippase GtrA